MAKNNDDVVIKRSSAKAKQAEADAKNDTKTEAKPKSKESELTETPKDYRVLYAKIFAALLGVFSILLFIALVSYTPKDELNAKITITELFSIFSSDSMIRIKADTTYNWLGLLGAVFSNVLINWTIGYLIIFLPIFLFFWALNIYKSTEISEKLIKSTMIYLIFSVLLSSFIGSFRNISWFADIPKEWTGAVGMFLSTIVGKLIGSFGAFLIFLILIVLVVIFGTNIRWKPLIDFISKSAVQVKDFIVKLFKFLFVKVKDFEEVNREMLKNTPENPIVEPEVPATDNHEATANVNPEAAAPTIIEPVGPGIHVIKTSSTEPARIIRSSFRPDTVVPAVIDEVSKTDSSNAKAENTDKKPLSIKIEIPKQETYIHEKPLGLRRDLPDESYSVGTRSTMASKDAVIEDNEFTANVEIPETIPEEIEDIVTAVLNLEPDEKSAHPLHIEVLEHVRPIDEIIEIDRKDEPEPKAPLSTDYFNVDEKEEIIEIDEALVIKSKSQTLVMPPPAKPIIPPSPVRIGSVPTASTSRAPLVVHLEELPPEEPPSLNTPLGVKIHDEEIFYEAPSAKLLDIRAEEMKVSDEELKTNARILQEKLETFKIFIENLTVTPGPVVTQYEFVPAAGIKISRIESLSDDLAMALKAKGIRIIAPIPGKGTIGIEIPNMYPSVVRFSHVVNTSKFYESQAKLPIALGKSISGEVIIADLTKAPHLMIAGSTGSGKSVGINTIINSLLYRMKPSDLKFVIIDPKKVELQQYSRLRHHFLAISPDIDDSIITGPQDAVAVLKSVVIEMENRYDILARVGQRNISDYNDKVKAGTYKSIKDFDHRQMPYIVVVIDELADLMLTASKEVEEPIIRLAQMARAIGIHLIIATQRPSVDVITGIIKANFPARIAYLVASKVDSRTILDISGAEQLLGNGDMLFLPSGSPKPVRIQNAFISTDEVENICNFIGKQDGYSQPYMLPSIVDDKTGGGNLSADERDPLFADAAKLVIQHQQASVSLVQRRLKVGYARAGRIIDELEDAGIVGPNEGSKARIVLYESEADLERIL